MKMNVTTAKSPIIQDEIWDFTSFLKNCDVGEELKKLQIAKNINRIKFLIDECYSINVEFKKARYSKDGEKVNYLREKFEKNKKEIKALQASNS